MCELTSKFARNIFVMFLNFLYKIRKLFFLYLFIVLFIGMLLNVLFFGRLTRPRGQQRRPALQQDQLQLGGEQLLHVLHCHNGAKQP